MKVGDLVIRKINVQSRTGLHKVAMKQREKLGVGIILSKQMGWGCLCHGLPSITVFYAKIGKTYDIAESLMEVISAS
tara:strand:+ start:192 stop:422 length:231 start_codon:yes stop_codon:yes gene_type:complete